MTWSETDFTEAMRLFASLQHLFATEQARLRKQQWYRVPELVERSGLSRQWWYRRQKTLGARSKVEGGRCLVFPHSALQKALGPDQVPPDGLA